MSGRSVLPLKDLDDAVQHVERFRFWPLKGVAPDDRAVGAAGIDRPYLTQDAAEVLGFAAGEDDDALAVEGRLHDVTDARRRGRDVDVLLLVDRLRRGQFEMRG